MYSHFLKSVLSIGLVLSNQHQHHGPTRREDGLTKDSEAESGVPVDTSWPQYQDKKKGPLGEYLGTSTKKSRNLPPFGHPMRKEFLLNPDFISLNHGAYGTYPKAVQTALREYQDRVESHPDLWMKQDVKPELTKVRAQLAKFVNANVEDIVVVQDTTSGINAVFRSIAFNPGERILQFSTIHKGINNIIKYIVDKSEGSVTSLVFNVTYPISNDQLVKDLEAFLEETHDPEHPIRIALIDHISSAPGVIVPIQRIIPLLKARNITVVIDGAHGIGHVPIDLTKLAPDYYVTSSNKWLYVARTCGVMYVDKKHQSTIHPAHISLGYSQPSDFQEEFFWTGTIDYSPYMTVSAALEFRRALGGENVIRNYTHSLAIAGGQYLADRFGTEIIQEEDQIGNMVDVRLPLNNPDDPELTSDWWVDTLLHSEPQVYASQYKHGGKWYSRLSAQIYNDLDDFKTIGDVFQKLCDEINAKNSTV